MRRNIKFPHFYCFLTRRVFSYLGCGLSGASVRSAAMAEASVMYVRWTSHSAARPAIIRRPVDLRLRNTAGAPKVTMPELMFLDSRGERLLARHTRAGSQEAWPGDTGEKLGMAGGLGMARDCPAAARLGSGTSDGAGDGCLAPGLAASCQTVPAGSCELPNFVISVVKWAPRDAPQVSFEFQFQCTY